MDQDRIHAQKPQQDPENWSTGQIESIRSEDGHCIVTVHTDEGLIELTVTTAIRDLFVSRLPTTKEESPVGEVIWFKRRGRH
ncbi:hypothetical protein K0C01_10425 [Salinarchaeum sp. IM2453]|uniref:DUF7861 family protein n=1 Tax=Salinarchaeum sp. IM2453 TaxID=2862870 RepID=UPI001C8349C6|nr:hypothetical protein [Salinarchaeum sp. IM2453]QZA88193.1 hypothetical protein K0C01_10425 [Salinarchaeum sp. IM2453]